MIRNNAQQEFDIVKGVFIAEPPEREPTGGAGVRGGEAKAASKASCLDNGYHIRPYITESGDIREKIKDTATVRFYVEGSGIRVKLRNNSRKRKPEERKSLLEILSPERYKLNKAFERGKRGKITRFTEASARRLREKLVNLNKWILPYFVTLTFPDNYPTAKEAHRHLKVFAQRLQRSYPFMSMIWKMEYQTRKSGKREGEYAPHFHIFLWGVMIERKTLQRLIKRIWFEIVGSEDKRHLRNGANVTEIKNYRGMRNYLKKYMYKPFSHEEEGSLGRCWGVIGKVPYGEVKEVVVHSETALRFMRRMRKHEENMRTEWNKKYIRYLYRPVSKYKRLYEKENVEKWIDLLFHIEGPVPF